MPPDNYQEAPGPIVAHRTSPTNIGLGLLANLAATDFGFISTGNFLGHAANHVCLLLLQDGLLFSGDHILNGSTTVIDPPDGNMTDYLNALDALCAACVQHGVQYILPAHGHVIPHAVDAIAKLKAHRLQREAKIAAVMQANPQGSPDDWLPLAYDDVHPRIWPVAKRSLLAHVERLTTLKTL